MTIQNNNQRQKATLGGGCFWCLEAVYDDLQGVDTVVSGYMGGHVDNPSYRAVCDGTTGHVEVVQVTFDPAVTTFKEILQIFFTIHDPTTLNRQGADVGTQYRSVIFYEDEGQRETAVALINELEAEKVWSDPIVTEVVPMDTLYVAEDYHQDYFKYNSRQPYCQFVVAPKLKKFRKQFAAKRKSLA